MFVAFIWHFDGYYRCRKELLQTLEAHQVLVVMDWAMKWLPAHFREKQADFFGKRGKSWHVSVLIFRDSTQELKVNILFHGAYK